MNTNGGDVHAASPRYRIGKLQHKALQRIQGAEKRMVIRPLWFDNAFAFSIAKARQASV